MTIESMFELAGRLRVDGSGIGAFNVIQIEHAEAIISGAEAAESTPEVVVHLDHATREDLVDHAISMGVGSVMFDASALPHLENVERTSAVTARARACCCSR